ncbi:hypothetical protein [Yoonia sp. 2307UL14-13]|uniref:hypothetical protein n=1 Tax=Yoonia sp. 2307UL14-13 TaxID=3126506 RepID=UPI003098C8FB
MSDPTIQIIIFMLVTFALGLALGWLIWRFGGADQQELASSEVTFWKSNLEQVRAEREADLQKIAVLQNEREVLKKQLAAAKSS